MNRRHLWIVGALLIPGIANAEGLVRAFGTSEAACLLYADGGGGRVYSNGDAAGVVVTPTEVVGLEWICQIGQYTGDQAALACYGEGEEWTSSATIFEDDEGLVFSYANGTAYLRRC